jgi:hypothetical protein
VKATEPTRDEWLCGYAAALAAVVRLHHLPSTVADVLTADGITLEDLEDAGVEDFDLRQLKGLRR